jgi:hypothetical protein
MRRPFLVPAVFLVVAAVAMIAVQRWVASMWSGPELQGTLPLSFTALARTSTMPPLLVALVAVTVLAAILAGVYGLFVARRSRRTRSADQGDRPSDSVSRRAA